MDRIGFGYDSHRFAGDCPLMLGGCQIEHARGLAGHSDADVLLHAITDAILGAIGEDDIGQIFPDTDPANAGANSAIFVGHAIELAGRKGYRVGNCDVTVIAELPKLGPHKKVIRQNVAELLGVSEGAVSIKATTNEGMGAVGRGEGIVVMAVVMMVAC